MIRLIRKPLIITMVMFTLASFTARALGRWQSPNPALSGFRDGCEGRSFPCWYGIVPRRTTVSEGRALLRGKSYLLATSLTAAPSHRSIHETDLPCGTSLAFERRFIKRLMIRCHALQLGDWIQRFGEPDGIGILVDQISVFYFEPVRLRVSLRGPLQPTTLIEKFSFPLKFGFNEDFMAWHGCTDLALLPA